MNAKEEHKPGGTGAKPDTGVPQSTEVEHTPIVVDGGSAKIDFSSDEYRGEQVRKHTSSGLFLDNIENLDDNDGHPDTGDSICHTVGSDEVCRIVVHCKLPGHNDSNFVVEGGGRNAVIGTASRSSFIDFSEDEYPVQTVSNGRRIHANAGRKIVKLEIFTLTNGQWKLIHDCPLVPPNGKCQFTIRDPHVNPPHHNH
jgi:hypothetical protein